MPATLPGWSVSLSITCIFALAMLLIASLIASGRTRADLQ